MNHLWMVNYQTLIGHSSLYGGVEEIIENAFSSIFMALVTLSPLRT